MKHFLLLYIIVACLFSAIVLAAKPKPPSDEPFAYTVTIYWGDKKEGMNIPWTKRDTVQTTIYEHIDEYISRYTTDEKCFRFYIRSPREGDNRYPPYWLYGYMNQNNLLTIHSVKVPECE
jgi:hypothetical protein